jgi:hypothetical protein
MSADRFSYAIVPPTLAAVPAVLSHCESVQIYVARHPDARIAVVEPAAGSDTITITDVDAALGLATEPIVGRSVMGGPVEIVYPRTPTILYVRGAKCIAESAFSPCATAERRSAWEVNQSLRHVGCQWNLMLYIEPGLEEIGAYAFSGLFCLGGRLLVPSSVFLIGTAAFEGCCFDSLAIAAGRNSQLAVKSGAFMCNALEMVILGSPAIILSRSSLPTYAKVVLCTLSCNHNAVGDSSLMPLLYRKLFASSPWNKSVRSVCMDVSPGQWSARLCAAWGPVIGRVRPEDHWAQCNTTYSVRFTGTISLPAVLLDGSATCIDIDASCALADSVPLGPYSIVSGCIREAVICVLLAEVHNETWKAGVAARYGVNPAGKDCHLQICFI